MWGHVWPFEVTKNFTRQGIADQVWLEFTGLDGVPKAACILLVDRHLQMVTDLRRNASYSFHLGAVDAASTDEKVRFVLLVGSEKFREAQEAGLPGLPTQTVLHAGYPNPFNPSTLIRYYLAHAGSVVLNIYDVRGSLVRALVERRQEAGRYEVAWNGVNDTGERVASGIYLCRLTAEHYSETRKLAMIR